MQDQLEIGLHALEAWTHAIKTGDWEPYIALLTDDYSFWLPEGGSTLNGMGIGLEQSKEQLVKSAFNQKRLQAYKNQPSRISTGNSHIVFEFLFDSEHLGRYVQNCLALSFDLRQGQVAACREYHCVLLNFE